MIKELQKILESEQLDEKKFNFKSYIKGLKLKSSDEKKLIDFLNKNKDGVESAEDIFRAATDLKIKLDEENLNENRLKVFQDNNSDRAGKSLLNIKNKEVSGSIVLSKYAYAHKDGKHYRLVVFDVITDKPQNISLTAQEMKNLKKIK